jgi:hypothetical protein
MKIMSKSAKSIQYFSYYVFSKTGKKHSSSKQKGKILGIYRLNTNFIISRIIYSR